MDFKVIQDEEAFLAEKESWTSLYYSDMKGKAATPFQSWEWCYFWWKYREESRPLFIIKAFTGKKIEGYAPFVINNQMAEFIGGRDIDYGRFLINDNPVATINGFLNIIIEKGYGLALQEMCSRDAQLHIVERCLETKKRYLVHRTTRTTYVQTSQFKSFEEYLQTLSGSMRNKTIKTALKRGIVIQKETYCEDLEQVIQRIFESRQEARGGDNSIRWAFPVLRELTNRDLAEIYIARVEEEPVGFLVSLTGIYGKNIWLVAFHMKYLSFYPGQMLFYQVVKDGFSEDCQIVDFMRGDYDFKMRWNVELDTNYTIYLFKKSSLYWKHRVWFLLRPKLKKIVYSNEWLKKVYKKYA